MKRGFSAVVFVAGLAMALAATAYENPLSEYTVRDAYFLGRRRDEKTGEVLSQYVRRFPVPARGPHVAEVEFRTPYQQVVMRAYTAPDGYSAQIAAEQYREFGQRIIVRVRILLTPTYPAHSPIAPVLYEPVKIRPGDFWRDFKFEVLQRDAIAPKRISGRLIYTYPDFGLPGLVGADVEMEFDAKDFSAAPVRVAVLTPDGQSVETVFDLSKLP